MPWPHLKEAVFNAISLQAFSELIRKAFGINHRTHEFDCRVGEVPISFRESSASGGAASTARCLCLTPKAAT